MSGPWQKKVDVPGNLWSKYTLFYSSSGEGTRATKSSSEKQWEGQGQHQGPRAQHKAIPQIPPSVLPGMMLMVTWQMQRPTDADCPASAAATLITFGEKYNHSTVILPHFRVCSAHCGVTQAVSTARFPTQPSAYCNWKSVQVSYLNFYL